MIRLLRKILNTVPIREINEPDIYFVVEGGNWTINQGADALIPYMKHFEIKKTREYRLRPQKAILYFGSVHVFLNFPRIDKIKVPIIVTCFHIVDSDPYFDKIKEKKQYVSMWHTSCTNTKRKLIAMGIPESKICLIPVELNSKFFAPVTEEEKRKRQAQAGIDSNRIVVGSFQKDGNGWGEGLEPKLIKGPDIFCDVLERLKDKYDLHVILSGPARGYVKKRLDSLGIPYTHYFFEKSDEVSELYRMIDLYMVTSREEGGPRAIAEAMASGVPLITTKVGQAIDVVEDRKNAMLVDVEDVDELVNAFETVVNDSTLRSILIENGLKTAKQFDVAIIAQQYEKRLFKSVLESENDNLKGRS